MSDGQKIKIKSDFGKYNINNNDTIFQRMYPSIIGSTKLIAITLIFH